MSVSTKNAFAALRLDDDEASESVESTPAKEGAAKWGFGDASWADGCVGVMRRAAESTPAALWLSDSLSHPPDTGTPRRDGNAVRSDPTDTSPLVPDMRLKEPLVWCVAHHSSHCAAGHLTTRRRVCVAEPQD